MGDSLSEGAQPPPAPPSPPRHPWRRGPGLAGAVAALALALFAWQWYAARGEIAALREETARKLAEADAQNRAGRALAEQVRDALADVQAKLSGLENRIAESQDQQIALEALYQELSRGRDEWVYAEVEQTLLVASQQLAIAGNVRAALIALQAADARLQRLERPQLTGLRKAINRDIERLRALPHVDTLAISVRIDGLIAQVDGLPLAREVRARPARAAAPAGEPPAGAWARFWREAWAELRQLVQVQRVEREDAALIAPEEAFFLRENLKLRLVGARLALLARNAAAYRADIKAAREWLGRYFDTRDNSVAHAAAVLRGLHEAEVSFEVPDISATLEAMRGLRLSRERAQDKGRR